MSYKIRRISRARDKRADMMLQEAIEQSAAPPLHAETHRPTGTDPILPSDIGAETPAGAQTKADAAEARAKAYTDQEVGEVAQELNAHLNDKNNPHNVTTEQIGAETPAGAQAKAEAAAGAALAAANNYTDQEVGEVSQALDVHMSDGTQHKKTARFVVGTSTYGWTEKDCDYLCDGTDDQVEINNAINALPATGGEIVILDGTYNITARINVNKDNVSIRGNGNATILKRMWDSPLGEGVITLTSVEGCRVENLQIDGNNTTYTSSYNYGISLESSSNNTVTGNTCNNNNNNGIRLDSSSNNMIIGNTCKNNSNGIYLTLSSNNNTITGNTCNNNNYGIHLYLSNNNTITGNACSGNNYGIFLSSSSNNTVTGNTCNNNNDNGIRLYLSTNNTITGNTSNNNNINIYLYSSSNNNTITGNTCIRGTGTPGDYTTNQYTIILVGTNNNYNLITSNNCMGKAPVVQGGTGNTLFNNKSDASDDIQNISDYTDNPNTYIEDNYQPVIAFSTASRPLDVPVGFIWFDTELGLPIWWNGTDWIDASGNIV